MISFFILSSKIVFTFFSYHSAHTLVHRGEVWSSFGCMHAVVSTKTIYMMLSRGEGLTTNPFYSLLLVVREDVKSVAKAT